MGRISIRICYGRSSRRRGFTDLAQRRLAAITILTAARRRRPIRLQDQTDDLDVGQGPPNSDHEAIGTLLGLFLECITGKRTHTGHGSLSLPIPATTNRRASSSSKVERVKWLLLTTPILPILHSSSLPSQTQILTRRYPLPCFHPSNTIMLPHTLIQVSPTCLLLPTTLQAQP